MSIKNRTILAIVFLFSGIGAGFIAFPEENEIAFTYYTQASRLIAAEEYAQAERLLRAALEFSPGFADAWYLLSGIYLQNQDTLLQGLDFLQKSVSLDNWKFNKKTTVQKELAHILYRIKRYGETRALLFSLHNSSEVDAEIEILFIKTLFALRETELMNKVITIAIKKFPHEQELYILAAESFFSSKRILESLQTIEVGLQLIPGSPDLLFHKIKYTVDPEIKKGLVAQYLAGPGKKPEIAFAGLEADKENSKQYIDYFFANNGNLYLDLIRTMLNFLQGDEELLAYFSSLENASIANGKGVEKWQDLNKDGYYEEHLRFGKTGETGEPGVITKATNAMLEQLVIDNDQNGIAEVVLDFRDGQPVFLKQWGKDNHILYTYSIYPFLKSVSYPGAESTVEYFIIPFSLKYPVLKRMEQYLYEVDTAALPLSTQQVLNAAYRQDRSRNLTGMLTGTRDLLGGVITGEKIDTDTDGFFDYTLEYANNLPVKAYRDFDNNGVTDAVEFYKAGKLDRIEFDENHDNKTESVQYPDAPAGTTSTYWDYNFDGTYDARQQIRGRSVVYEFATRYDSRFNLKIQMNDGKITGITREGKEVPVARDGQDNLYWIGKKGSRFAGIMELPQGQYTRDGITWFIFRYNNDIYIEELQ